MTNIDVILLIFFSVMLLKWLELIFFPVGIVIYAVIYAVISVNQLVYLDRITSVYDVLGTVI